MDRVVDLNERLDGDGEALIARLAAGDVPRFQTDKREALDRWLREHGHISGDEPLSELGVKLRVASAMRSWVGDEGEVTAQAHEIVRGLAAAVENREAVEDVD
jgi:hypothetical protein